LTALEEGSAAATGQGSSETPRSHQRGDIERSSDLPVTELIQMAHRNAEKLHHSLSALLDVAALESGAFHVRLREVDLLRVAFGRYAKYKKNFESLGITGQWMSDIPGTSAYTILADSQKLGQAIDLCFQALLPRAENKGDFQVQVRPFSLELSCKITKSAEEVWKSAWSQSLVGFQGGMSSPYSAFGGVLQSEQAFLTRTEEGLGSEFLLIHEILRLHRGQFSAQLKDGLACLRLEFPELSNEDGLRVVLGSRASSLSTELGSVTLVLIQLPTDFTASLEVQKKIAENLFRSTDAIYPLSKKHQLALVLNDWKYEDVPSFVKLIQDRLRKSFKFELKESSQLQFGYAHCPSDSLDPNALVEIAEGRLQGR
jgi:hypothetical protein